MKNLNSYIMYFLLSLILLVAGCTSNDSTVETSTIDTQVVDTLQIEVPDSIQTESSWREVKALW